MGSIRSGRGSNLPENTIFIKERTRKENLYNSAKPSVKLNKMQFYPKSQDLFLDSISKLNMPKDHIAASSKSNASIASHSTTPLDEWQQLSLNLWRRINAGYIIPNQPPQSLTKSTYTCDPSQADKPCREHFRRRDSYSEYMEAAARFKHVMGNKKPLPKGTKKEAKDGKSTEISESQSVQSENPAGRDAAVADPPAA